MSSVNSRLFGCLLNNGMCRSQLVMQGNAEFRKLRQISLQARRVLSTRHKYLSRMNLQRLPPYPKATTKSCKSHQLLLYNDIIQMCHPGSFHLLPLGLRVLEKLTALIDEELQAVGAQKIAMPTLAPATLWKKTGRWETASELFRLNDRSRMEYCLGPTHEELVTNLMAHYSPAPYKQLPVMLYQITRKFRDELNPRYGLLRGREFEMKGNDFLHGVCLDLYSFDSSLESAQITYQLICDAYSRIFDRLELDYVKVVGATGEIGGHSSHEFHLPSTVGEDTLYLCDSCGYAVNAELIDAEDPGTGRKKQPAKCQTADCGMRKSQGIEVGHAFLLGTKYSAVLNSTYKDNTDSVNFTEMGCYGLGVSRILQASVEVLSEEPEIRWPSIIAPYQVCVMPQMKGYMVEKFVAIADEMSERLQNLSSLRGEVVIDDRITLPVSKRLREARRSGYPYIVIVGRKALETPSLLEVIDVRGETTEFLTAEQVCDKLSTVETL